VAELANMFEEGSSYSEGHADLTENSEDEGTTTNEPSKETPMSFHDKTTNNNTKTNLDIIEEEQN
jgi:hypothetical protein